MRASKNRSTSSYRGHKAVSREGNLSPTAQQSRELVESTIRGTHRGKVWNDRETSDVTVIVESTDGKRVELFLHTDVLKACQFFVSRSRWDSDKQWHFKDRDDVDDVIQTLELIYTRDFLGLEGLQRILGVLRVSQELLFTEGIQHCKQRLMCDLWLPSQWDVIEEELKKIGVEEPVSRSHQYADLTRQELVRKALESAVRDALSSEGGDFEELARANTEAGLQHLNEDVLWFYFTSELYVPSVSTLQGFRWIIAKCAEFKSWHEIWDVAFDADFNRSMTALLPYLFNWLVSAEGWNVHPRRRMIFVSKWCIRWCRTHPAGEDVESILNRLFRSFPASMASELLGLASRYVRDAHWGHLFRAQRDRILAVSREAHFEKEVLAEGRADRFGRRYTVSSSSSTHNGPSFERHGNTTERTRSGGRRIGRHRNHSEGSTTSSSNASFPCSL